jgi:L-alanine-DL-glutamate epimerase-like enolase superfamily enzyme
MKIAASHGREEQRDVDRVALVRNAIGPDAALYVDANGGYDRKQAVRLARAFEEQGVTWFEEPVSSDDLEGLRVVRDQSPIDIAAGEYGYAVPYFAAMCRSGAVDVLQADVSRCAGYTEWRRVAAVAAAHGLEISGHCAPALHLPVAAAVPNLRHVEWFHDHVRADRRLFEGLPEPDHGVLHPYVSGAGHGMTLRSDAPPPDAPPVDHRAGSAAAPTARRTS